jgi:hypothetical protein
LHLCDQILKKPFEENNFYPFVTFFNRGRDMIFF